VGTSREIPRRPQEEVVAHSPHTKKLGSWAIARRKRPTLNQPGTMLTIMRADHNRGQRKKFFVKTAGGNQGSIKPGSSLAQQGSYSPLREQGLESQG